MSQISPLKSLVSQNLFEQVTNYRNSAVAGEAFIRRSEAELGYGVITVASLVESVARVIFTPVVCLPMLVQSVIEREAYFNRIVTPMYQGILHNGVIALFSTVALVMNPVKDTLDFLSIGRSLWLIPQDRDE